MSNTGNRLQVFGGDNSHQEATPSPEFRRRLFLSAEDSDADSETDSESLSGRTASRFGSKSPGLREMNANKKLFCKDLSEYDNMDMDDMLDQLTAEEIDLLTREVDPDDSLMPPDQRTSYRCDKKATGPLDRKQLIEFIHQQAINDPDRPEMVPYQAGVVRGKRWVAPRSESVEKSSDEHVQLDLDDEYETALAGATENELVDLAAVLGFHSMMNQDQYHASLLSKKTDTEVGWGGVTRASQPKAMLPEPPNSTDPEQSIKQLSQNDPQLTQLNLNNIKNISDEQLERMFRALATNSQLSSLLMSNTALSDRHVPHIVAMLEQNKHITEISVESNFLSPSAIAKLVNALLKHGSVETFRAANQRSRVLGNKIEMEITKCVEQNHSLLQLGLHFDFNDARARVSAQLQKNRDRLREMRVKGPSLPAEGTAQPVEHAPSPSPSPEPAFAQRGRIGSKSANFLTPIGRVASPVEPPSPEPPSGGADYQTSLQPPANM